MRCWEQLGWCCRLRSSKPPPKDPGLGGAYPALRPTGAAGDGGSPACPGVAVGRGMSPLRRAGDATSAPAACRDGSVSGFGAAREKFILHPSRCTVRNPPAWVQQRVQPRPRLTGGRMLAQSLPLSPPGFGRRVRRAEVLRDMHGRHHLAQRHRLRLGGLRDPRGAR